MMNTYIILNINNIRIEIDFVKKKIVNQFILFFYPRKEKNHQAIF